MALVLAVWAITAVLVCGVPARLKRFLNPTPPPPAVASYPPPVPVPTYIPQAEVNRRFAELVGSL